MTFVVEIEKIVAGGDGLGRYEGRVVFVSGTAPGETHRVEVVEEKKDFIRARSVACLEPSKDRREPPCPYYERCGGCSLMHLSPDAQLRVKRDILVESLGRNGVPASAVDPVPSPESGYRTRLRFHVAGSGESVAMGFRRRRSHRVEDIERCLLASDELNRVWRDLRAWLKEDRVRARDVESIELQESSHERGRIIGRFLVRSMRGIREFEGKHRHELLARTSLEGAVVTTSRERGGVRVGRPSVQHRIGHGMLRQSAGSFFQANRFLLDRLVSSVAPPRQSKPRRLVDLYCGVGFFAIPLAEWARETLGVETAAGARRDALANARAARRERFRFVSQDAARFARGFRFAKDDYVVLDPPRGGLPRALRESLSASALRGFCYVSCDPPALGRDAAFFQERGFRIAGLTLLDLFPNTHHFETVAHFRRRDALDPFPGEGRY